MPGFETRLSGNCRVRLRAAAGLVIAAALAGCIGPRSLELTRLRYDEAVYETSEQQWLRNIVRLRYGDLPTLLDVSAITSQFELSEEAFFTGGRERDSLNNFGGPTVRFRDAPTLSYTPRDPTELTRAMVAPVGITAMGLIANNGWGVEDVLRLMVAEINGLENTPGAEQFVPEHIPPLTPFGEVARLAGELRRERVAALLSVDEAETVSTPFASTRVEAADVVEAASHQLEFRPADAGDDLVLIRTSPGYRLAFSEASIGHPGADALRELLRLTPGRLQYEIDRVPLPGGAELYPLPPTLNAIHVQTRTLLEMVTVLSKGVQLPEEHICGGVAAQTVGPDGMVFDWTQVTRGLFHVCSQKKKPKDAAVAIEYKGYWFYIPASDKRSKSTLALIQALFNLQLSEPKKAGPLLTLPVGL